MVGVSFLSAMGGGFVRVGGVFVRGVYVRWGLCPRGFCPGPNCYTPVSHSIDIPTVSLIHSHSNYPV